MLNQTFELTVRQLCEEVLAEPDPQALPGKIIEHVQQTFPVEWSTLWLTEQTEPRGELRLRIAAAAGPAQKLMTADEGKPAVYPFGEGLTGAIARRKKTINITKPEDFKKYQHKCKYDKVMYNRPKAGELCRCVLGVPLLLRTNIPGGDEPRVIGVLKLENVKRTSTHEQAYFTPRDVKIVEGYAAVIAVALEKAQVQANSVLIGQGLLEVSQSLLEGLGTQPDFEGIVRQTAKVISAEASALWLRSGHQLRLEAAAGYPGNKENVPPYDLRLPEVDSRSWDFNKKVRVGEIKRCGRVGLTVFVARTRKRLNLKTLDEVGKHFAWKGVNDKRMWKRKQGRACYSLLAIPLIDTETGDLKGIFKIENKRPTIFQLQSYFMEEDERLLTTLGNSISLSLIISERIDRLRRLEKLVGDVRMFQDLNTALFFIITGLTHGAGLQYNRAMIFLKDEADPETLVCRFAIGEMELNEWEHAMKRPRAGSELDIDSLLQKYQADPERFRENAMMQQWKNYKLQLKRPGQVIVKAADQRTVSKYGDNEPKKGDALRGFANGDFVLIPIRFEDDLLGIIYADNAFTGNRISKFECDVLDLFAGMAAAIIEASKVPRRLKKEWDNAWRIFSGPAAHRLGTEAHIIDNEVFLYIKKELEKEPLDTSGTVSVRKEVIDDSLKVINQSINRLRLAVRDYRQTTVFEDPKKFDLVKLVKETLKSTTNDLKGIQTKLHCDCRSMNIYARRGRLAYVFEELLINAWKESAAGRGELNGTEPAEVRVWIGMKREGDTIVSTVCDTGPGIPDKLTEVLFKRPMKGRHGGTGLGLYNVDRLLRENGGRIEIVHEHKPKGYNGACFQITIPRDLRTHKELSNV